MLTTMEHGWAMDVDRGPDWLFVRLKKGAPDATRDVAGPLAEDLWTVMRQSFSRRLVLDLSEVERLNSPLLGQLISLGKKVREVEGVLRLTGVSPDNERVIQIARLDQRLPSFPTRADAVRGERPAKPR
jgi:anti-anti-sigma factor